MSHPGYPNSLPAKLVIERLRSATRDASHEFWPDDVSILDDTQLDAARIHGPRQITDLYPLALALRRGGRFVTFDASLATTAIVAFDGTHLVKL